MSTNEAFAEWKAFLESTPPNTPKTIVGLATYHHPSTSIEFWDLPRPRLQLHCATDGGVRWFDCTNTGDPRLGFSFIYYKCRDCGSVVKTFAVYSVINKVGAEDVNTSVEVMKLGEYPPFGAPISTRIAKLLDRDDRELYRKGTRAEAQGLGLGAASYFRRIVENQWKLLVTEIREAAAALGVKDLSIFDRALAEKQFTTAVDMLKDALPQKLLILDGRNPLTLLHKPLSVQLHGLTDAECLQQANDIRLVLTALLENIADVLRSQDDLKEAADRLTQLKSS